MWGSFFLPFSTLNVFLLLSLACVFSDQKSVITFIFVLLCNVSVFFPSVLSNFSLFFHEFMICLSLVFCIYLVWVSLRILDLWLNLRDTLPLSFKYVFCLPFLFLGLQLHACKNGDFSHDWDSDFLFFIYFPSPPHPPFVAFFSHCTSVQIVTILLSSGSLIFYLPVLHMLLKPYSKLFQILLFSSL